MNNINLYRDVDEALVFSVERLGFKAEQREVVKGFVSGNDVFAALPTGPRVRQKPMRHLRR